MQDRYAGDAGDFVKFGLLRALSPGMRLGVAWYLYPDEGHNEDGRHVAYLNEPERWRNLDPELFDSLKRVVGRGRSVAALEEVGVLDATFDGTRLGHGVLPAARRSEARANWFEAVRERLASCDLVFADPDNGLTDDRPDRRRARGFGKQMPLGEALSLAEDRTLVVYHHNSRFKGGHDLEVEHWRSQIGSRCIAVRANAYACRTFFIVNPSSLVEERATSFCEAWRRYRVRLEA